MKRKYLLIVICLSLVGLVFAGGLKEVCNIDNTKMNGIWSFNIFDGNKILVDSGNEFYAVGKDEQLSVYNNSGEKLKTYSVVLNLNKLKVSDGTDSGTAIIKMTDFGFYMTFPNGEYYVMQPRLDGIYRSFEGTSMTTLEEKDYYTVIDDGIMSKYYYTDNSLVTEPAKFYYKDGKYFYDDVEENCTLTNIGYTCTSLETGMVYCYVRALDGDWVFTDGEDWSPVINFNNNARSDYDEEENEDYYGFIWYKDNIRHAVYHNQDGTIDEYVSKIILNKDKELIYTMEGVLIQKSYRLFNDTWKMTTAQKADKTPYSQEELELHSGAIRFNGANIGAEIWDGKEIYFSYTFDYKTNILKAVYDTREETFRLSDDYKTLIWEFNKEGSEYNGESYVYSNPVNMEWNE